MKSTKKLHVFSYKFDEGSGPLSLVKLQGQIKKGNCRLTVQDYYYTVHNIYLKPEQILLPAAFKKVGRFVKMPNLKPGDLIYAERLRNKKGEIVYKLPSEDCNLIGYKPKEQYKDEDERILHFHTAIYLGKLDKDTLSFIPFKPEYSKGTPVIWHSSFISNGTAIWSLEKFLNYYQLVAVKRIL